MFPHLDAASSGTRAERNRAGVLSFPFPAPLLWERRQKNTHNTYTRYNMLAGIERRFAAGSASIDFLAIRLTTAITRALVPLCPAAQRNFHADGTEEREKVDERAQKDAWSANSE